MGKSIESIPLWTSETWSFLIPDGLLPGLDGIPTRFAIISIHPNPFNPSTTVVFGSSGLYFLRLRSSQGWEDIRRMVYLK